MKLTDLRGMVALRATLLVGVMTVLSGVIGRLTLEALRAPCAAVAGTGLLGLSTLSFAQALTALCAVALLACWLWVAGSATVLTVAATLEVLRAGARVIPAGTVNGCDRSHPALRVRDHASHGLPPRAVRRFVVAFLGVTASAALAVPAQALQPDRPTLGSAHAPARGLSGLALPDRTVAVAPARGAPARAVLTVRPGQSLWSIAAHLLPENADQDQIVAVWRQLWQLNGDALGPDPDLIFPGTRLAVPRHGHLRKDTP
jgi:hypothetical protein